MSGLLKKSSDVSEALRRRSEKSMQGKKVYLVVGVPGSGKSWVANQLKDKFTYVHHDGFIGHINHPEVYVKEITKAASTSDKPILAEAPFSISQIKDPLEKEGLSVEPVFILEDPRTLKQRYETDKNRDGKPLPKGHLTRMETYRSRAKEWGAFSGNSTQVLEHLKNKVG